MPFPFIPVAGLLVGVTGLALTLRKPKIPPAVAQAAINAPPRAAVPAAAHAAAIIAEQPETTDEEALAAVAAANTLQFVQDNKLQERRFPIAEQARDAPAPTTREPVSFVRENPTPTEAPAKEEDDSILSSITSLFDGELR